MKEEKLADLVEEKINGEWGIESLNGSGVKVLRTTNFTNEGRLNLKAVVEREIDKDIVKKKKLLFGDTIIEKSGGSPTQPVGRVVYFNLKGEDYLCNNFTAILRPKKTIYPRYFFYSLFAKHQSKRTERYQNKTTGILNLKLERYLEEEKINVPNFKTQQKIAYILEQVDTARQKRKQANQLTEQFLQSAFIEMFGDPVNNNKGYKFKKLEDVAIINMGQSPSGDSYNSLGKGSPLLNGPTEFGIKYPKEKQWTIEPTKFSKSGDILFCVRGATAGRMNWSDKKYCIGRGLAAIYSKGEVPNEFIYKFLEMKYSHFQNLGQGSTFINLNKDLISELQIPVPPLPLQKKFASLVERVEKLREKQRESERELENLFQALMQIYFGN